MKKLGKKDCYKNQTHPTTRVNGDYTVLVQNIGLTMVTLFTLYTARYIAMVCQLHFDTVGAVAR